MNITPIRYNPNSYPTQRPRNTLTNPAFCALKTNVDAHTVLSALTPIFPNKFVILGHAKVDGSQLKFLFPKKYDRYFGTDIIISVEEKAGLGAHTDPEFCSKVDTLADSVKDRVRNWQEIQNILAPVNRIQEKLNTARGMDNKQQIAQLRKNLEAAKQKALQELGFPAEQKADKF